MQLQPIEKQNRVDLVDALRGLALLGILLANVPLTGDASSFDRALGFLFHLLIEKKFITIFSILFGFGFYIQQKRAQQAGIAFPSYYFKRMLILLMIGCLHAYVFWNGDIIRNYAICGMFLIFICKWSSKKILITGILFSVFFTALVYIANGIVGIHYSYDVSIVKEHPVIDSYGHYLWINARTDSFVNFLQDSPITMVFCFGNMLIGYWMARTGFFQRTEKFVVTRRKLMLSGLLLGIAASYVFCLVTSGEIELTPPLLWLPFMIVAGMILQSLFYISAFIKLFQQPSLKKGLLLFSAIGKMSLTNYLLQTIFYLVVFFHWTQGPQLFGKIGRSETYLLALGFFILQILFSRLWLKHFDQGPVETIWKKLSYQYSKS